MLLEKERTQIATYGKKMIEHGLTKGTGGNISIYHREKQLFAISPSGLSYTETTPEDVVVVKLDGTVVDGSRKPSSEIEMHRIFYLQREDIQAVVHTHSPFATTVSALHWDLPAASYLVAFAGKNVRCSEYATFGTSVLAEKALEAMEDRNAVLLANHGLLAGGNDLHHAFNIAEEIEYCAEIFVRARAIGTPVIIPDEEMEHLIKKFETYGV